MCSSDLPSLPPINGNRDQLIQAFLNLVKNAAEKIPELNYCESITETLRDADLIMLLTEWSEYRALDPVEVKKLVKSATIFDGRNALDVARWQSAGWRLLALGRPL